LIDINQAAQKDKRGNHTSQFDQSGRVIQTHIAAANAIASSAVPDRQKDR
jgi:hypothetical protein